MKASLRETFSISVTILPVAGEGKSVRKFQTATARGGHTLLFDWRREKKENGGVRWKKGKRRPFRAVNSSYNAGGRERPRSTR